MNEFIASNFDFDGWQLYEYKYVCIFSYMNTLGKCGRKEMHMMHEMLSAYMGSAHNVVQ